MSAPFLPLNCKSSRADSADLPRIWSADQIRGKSAESALELLQFSGRKGADIIKKVLESAIANAEHNEGADVDELKVSTIFVDEGMTMKRIRPRAKGRADRILKRSCHITVKVSEK